MEWRLDDSPEKLLADLADGKNVAESSSSSSRSTTSATDVQAQSQEAEAPAGNNNDNTELPRQPGCKETEEEEYAGVLKARLDQNLRIGLLWEGRVKSLLFSLGSGIDLRHTDKPFRTLGLEIQFSS